MTSSSAISDDRKAMPVVYVIGAIAALAGLLFGMDIGVISGALPFIEQEFHISDQTQEIIVSSMMFGAAFGAAGGGFFSRRFGRKLTLAISGIIFIAGALTSALAWSPEALIGARIVLGVAVGISSYIAPIYLSEIAPERIRGTLISFYQLMIMGGILVAYLSNAAFSYSGGWRWMLGVIAIPAVLLVLGMIVLPRSPRWLASSHRDEEARRVLMRLRGHDREQVDTEMGRIRESLNVSDAGWKLFRSNTNFRRSVGLGMVLQFMQQFTGANVILYYAPRILELAGYDSASQQLWGTVIIGLVMTLATFIAIGFVDRVGRKPLLYIGFTVMGTCMVLLGVLYEYGLASTFAKYFALSLLGLFVISYAMSAAPMVWILCSEIQPLKGRDFGVACSTVTNWVANMIIGATFLTLLNTLGNAHTFWLYAGLNFLFILLTLALLPETKGISLENIERNLMAGRALRRIGR
ncbi:sugar porter family MFS transporter [Kushneria phosphatilytica]|uniref:Sugar porter family MFS transporter n=1 Tax=Kushneria phosphatilytica TaxID=657387 RepID=A0A1S1NZL0_9GAMM|nr:sugar porter family MFS transporter [Kushneria phosphatilytica]OHV13832.1 MFS transporter [Kushneria phosphatilytica]QEL10387.1 sugar porter family MFS transporter [Kushneria phosphatilytica]